MDRKMHIHTVFFWLNDDMDDADRQRFADELNLLMSDPNISDGNFGTPAATDRPVIDSSYDYGMVLKFRNLAAQEAYQKSSEHDRFIDNCAHMWSRIQVYDINESLAAE